jgi:hypothetical protein
MLLALALAAQALRSGLALRTARRRGRPPRPAERRAHLRVAKPAALLLLVGLPLGPLSAVWLRGLDAFGTLHAAVALLAAALFAAAAWLGHALEHGAVARREAHAAVALAAVLAGAAAFATGFVLLP